MLVLSRKKNETIIINDNITVTVIEIRGDKVRLGIEAPKNVITATAPAGAQPQRWAQLTYCTARLMERRSPYGCRRTCECHPAWLPRRPLRPPRLT